jgi:RNA polymerase sigma-70 factor, ECF subfamily
MTETSDEQIIELILAPKTHEQGFRMLIIKFREPLYIHIRKMLGNHDDTDDVLQNTFIKVFKNIDRFEQKSKLYTWLYRIATNEAITFINTRNKKETTTIDDPEKPQINTTADTDIDSTAVQEKLDTALKSLPEKQLTVFNLRYYQEMPYEEMSKLLNTSVGALKASYHHAVKKIETHLLK